MSDPQLPGVEIQRPPYLLNVRLNKGKARDIDLRAVSNVERSFQARETWVFWSCGADPLEIHYSEFERVHRGWRAQQERRAAMLPASAEVKNLNDHDRPFIEVESLSVLEWHRERDGKGKPERVVMQMDVVVADIKLSFVRQFKSRGALDELIDILIRHREGVWPTI
jgi:hypothetical protein